LEWEKKVDWVIDCRRYFEAKKLKDDMDSMNQQIIGANRRRFNMSKEEKQRLRVLNIYDHNASIRLDKEHEEWRASI
jgi:hypothetical protein